MTCLEFVLEKLKTMGVPISTEYLAETVSFYCNGGVPPEEIVSEICAVSKLNEVLKKLKELGFNIDASVRTSVLRYLREGWDVSKILEQYLGKNSPKPRL